MTLIPEYSARKDKLAGSDFVIGSYSAYHDELSRDNCVVSLNREALKIFGLSLTIREHLKLKIDADMINQPIKNEKLTIHEYSPSVEKKFIMENYNLEAFFIATGFELHFKSWLLQNNFIVHCINKKDYPCLFYKQKNEPITKKEFMPKGFEYDSKLQMLTLDGLTKKSLGFRTLCEKKYQTALNTSDEIMEIVKHFKKLRNEIHFPVENYFFEIGGNFNSDIMVSFINDRIVKNSNNLINKHRLKFALLDEIPIA